MLLLPDPCLLAVLRCCAGDPRSICSAARAHSRLHQAAVDALSSITTVLDRVQVNSFVDVYLPKHGQHVESICLQGSYDVRLPGVRSSGPAGPQPNQAQQPGAQLPRRAAAARQLLSGGAGLCRCPSAQALRLHCCTLVTEKEGAPPGLAAALALLPELEHLSITIMPAVVAGDVWLKLSQLTYLELEGPHLNGPGRNDSGLQHLSALTRLVDLRLSELNDFCFVNVGKLPGLQRLTRLQVTSNHDMFFYPAVLAGKTLLQHLELQGSHFFDDATGSTLLLSQLQDLQQLTCLVLDIFGPGMGYGPYPPYPPVAAYSALTASSKLHHLDLSTCLLPADIWQHVFSTSRQLPHLHVLDVSYVKHPGYHPAVAPEATRLVSCCPWAAYSWNAGRAHGSGASWTAKVE